MADKSKGDYNQECNRKACSNKNAVFYNHSTLKYYCGSCSVSINEYAREFELTNGHKLCIKLEENEVQKR